MATRRDRRAELSHEFARERRASMDRTRAMAGAVTTLQETLAAIEEPLTPTDIPTRTRRPRPQSVAFFAGQGGVPSIVTDAAPGGSSSQSPPGRRARPQSVLILQDSASQAPPSPTPPLRITETKKQHRRAGVFALSAELAAEASDDRRKSMSFTPGGSTVDPLENDKFAARLEELRSLIKGHKEGAVAKRKSVVLSAVDPDPSLAVDASRTERAPVRGREAPSAAAAELHSRRMSARLPPSKPADISIAVSDAATSELQAQIAELKKQLEVAEEDKRKLMQELRIERNLRIEAEKSLEQVKQAHGIS